MKKVLIIYTIAAAVSLEFMSCSQDEIAGDGTNANKQTVTFVSGDETSTRTSMGGAYTDTQFPFYWEGGDAIYVEAMESDNQTCEGTSSAITGKVNGSTSFAKQSKAIFTGSVTALPTGGSYKVIYTGTGSYNTTNCRTGISVNTSSDAEIIVIPPIQTRTIAQIGTTTNFGEIGDCGTATATANGDGTYKFKLDHKAAYLILMPRWTDNTTNNYLLKSVTITLHYSSQYLSGRFGFEKSFTYGSYSTFVHGFVEPVANTWGSHAIKISINGTTGVTLPTTTDQSKSINIAIKPLTTAEPLYVIYEVYDTKTKNTYYIEKYIKEQTYAENTITPITADLEAGYAAAKTNGYDDLITNNPTKTYNYPNIYYNWVEWDAPEGEPYFVSKEKQDDYNATTINTNPETDFTNVAYKGCKNCPTNNELSWYLAAGVYWDANKVWGPAPNQKGGLWLRKKAWITQHNIKGTGTTAVTTATFSSKYSGIMEVYKPGTGGGEYKFVDYYTTIRFIYKLVFLTGSWR
jgi:hypothetical protein